MSHRENDRTSNRAPGIVHERKCTWIYFRAVEGGAKPFEVQKDDRPEGFKVGDYLHLREWDVGTSIYCGPELMTKVTYVLRPKGGEGRGFEGVKDGCVILGIRVLS